MSAITINSKMQLVLAAILGLAAGFWYLLIDSPLATLFSAAPDYVEVGQIGVDSVSRKYNLVLTYFLTSTAGHFIAALFVLPVMKPSIDKLQDFGVLRWLTIYIAAIVRLNDMSFNLIHVVDFISYLVMPMAVYYLFSLCERRLGKQLSRNDNKNPILLSIAVTRIGAVMVGVILVTAFLHFSDLYAQVGFIASIITAPFSYAFDIQDSSMTRKVIQVSGGIVTYIGLVYLGWAWQLEGKRGRRD